MASEALGPQTLYRLRGLEHAVLGRELDLLHPFESIEPIRQNLRPDRAAPLTNWLVYHQAFATWQPVTCVQQAAYPSKTPLIMGELRLQFNKLTIPST